MSKMGKIMFQTVKLSFSEMVQTLILIKKTNSVIQTSTKHCNNGNNILLLFWQNVIQINRYIRVKMEQYTYSDLYLLKTEKQYVIILNVYIFKMSHFLSRTSC